LNEKSPSASTAVHVEKNWNDFFIARIKKHAATAAMKDVLTTFDPKQYPHMRQDWLTYYQNEWNKSKEIADAKVAKEKNQKEMDVLAKA
jgi:hypothetical protein